MVQLARVHAHFETKEGVKALALLVFPVVETAGRVSPDVRAHQRRFSRCSL